MTSFASVIKISSTASSLGPDAAVAAGVPTNLEKVDLSHCPSAPANSVEPPPGSKYGFSVECECLCTRCHIFSHGTAAIISA